MIFGERYQTIHYSCVYCAQIRKKLNLLKVKWKNRSFKTYLVKSYQISNIKYISSRKVQLKNLLPWTLYDG